jgi:hypothetical protein
VCARCGRTRFFAFLRDPTRRGVCSRSFTRSPIDHEHTSRAIRIDAIENGRDGRWLDAGACAGAPEQSLALTLWTPEQCPAPPVLQCNCEHLADEELLALLHSRFALQQTVQGAALPSSDAVCDSLGCEPATGRTEDLPRQQTRKPKLSAGTTPVTVHGATPPVAVAGTFVADSEKANYASRSDGAKIIAADPCATFCSFLGTQMKLMLRSQSPFAGPGTFHG